jgi:ubiquitin C-terminal hydrolase
MKKPKPIVKEPVLKKINSDSKGDGICGLQNGSLYCYMNSVLQCFIAIDDLKNYYQNE